MRKKYAFYENESSIIPFTEGMTFKGWVVVTPNEVVLSMLGFKQWIDCDMPNEAPIEGYEWVARYDLIDDIIYTRWEQVEITTE